MFAGKRGELNHSKGTAPRFFRGASSSGSSFSDRCFSARVACFLSRADRGESLASVSESSSLSDESEPDKLSSRSEKCQFIILIDCIKVILHAPAINCSKSFSDTGLRPRIFCLRL